MSEYRPHTVYPGGPECPCPGSGSVYHRWFNEGRTLGMHQADAAVIADSLARYRADLATRLRALATTQMNEHEAPLVSLDAVLALVEGRRCSGCGGPAHPDGDERCMFSDVDE